MKTLASLFLFSAFTLTAHAQLPGVGGALYYSVQEAQVNIMRGGLLPSGAPKSCDSNISSIGGNGSINITLAFGYQDISTGGEDGADSNLYPVGGVMDPDGRQVLTSALMSPCQRPMTAGQDAPKACGFSSRGGGFLTKQITDRFSGRSTRVNIRMISPSLSSSNAQNVSNPRQEQQSAAARQGFLSALQTDDVVVFLGHSRNGGGPDFFPPHQLANGAVNYGYYEGQQEGISSMVSALRGSAHQPKVVGVISCLSQQHFGARLNRAAPRSIMVTTTRLFAYNDILATGYTIVEAVLGQRCGSELDRVIRADKTVSGAISIRR